MSTPAETRPPETGTPAAPPPAEQPGERRPGRPLFRDRAVLGWALAYGVVLCLARALGEYGAVAVVSGRLVGQTQTLTLFVEERFQNFDQPAAFAAATALALMAIVILLLTKLLRPKD